MKVIFFFTCSRATCPTSALKCRLKLLGQMENGKDGITQYLRDWGSGDQGAFDEVVPLVYAELEKIARRYRSKENSGHTLQTSDIINEAYLKLLNQQETDWQDRSHFFAVASRVTRNLLVDHARTKNYQKRGGGGEKLSLDDVATLSPDPDRDIIALDDALTALAKYDERKCRIVELRYFGGFTAAETAEILGFAEITIKTEWLKAKAWLYKELNKAG